MTTDQFNEIIRIGTEGMKEAAFLKVAESLVGVLIENGEKFTLSRNDLLDEAHSCCWELLYQYNPEEDGLPWPYFANSLISGIREMYAKKGYKPAFKSTDIDIFN